MRITDCLLQKLIQNFIKITHWRDHIRLVMKALVYSYVGRKRRKQDFKKLWVCRVNAAARQEGLTYSTLKGALRNSSITLNLKMLAQLSVLDQQTFSFVVKTAKSN